MQEGSISFVVTKETSKTPERLFGKKIRSLRTRLGISQEELGFRAELHRNYVGQIERGMKSPTLGVILKLARVLNCPAGKLVSAVERQLG